jgi:hypothetical protein
MYGNPNCSYCVAYLESLSALHLAHVEEELLALLLLVGQEPELTCHNTESSHPQLLIYRASTSRVGKNPGFF